MTPAPDVHLFHARRTAAGFEVSGDHAASFGHRLAGRGDRAQDDGIWAGWHWDGQRLRIESCRFGLYPLFVLQRAGELCVSNRLSAIVERCAGSLALDDDAIAVFLRIGFMLGEATPYRDIRCVPAGAVAQWDGAQLQMNARPHQPSVPCDRSTDAKRIDRYAALFAASMARRGGDAPILLPLSGGRDSRHVLFELCTSGRPPRQCITAELPPPRSNEDLRVARLLCQRLDLPHRVVRQAGFGVAAMRRKNDLTSLCCDEHTWAMPLVDDINRTPATLFDGIGGDVLSAGLFSSTQRIEWFREGALEALAIDLIDGSETSWQTALQLQAYRRFSRERAIGCIVDALRPHVEQPNPIASFFFWNRTRREIALYSFGMYRCDSTVFAPYLDHALFDFLMSLPAEDVVDKSFHSRAIAHAYPQWADLPYTLPDHDAQAAVWSAPRRRVHHARLAAGFARHLLRRGSQCVRRGELIRRLPLLAGRAAPGRYWFDIERIVWLTQVEALAAG